MAEEKWISADHHSLSQVQEIQNEFKLVVVLIGSIRYADNSCRKANPDLNYRLEYSKADDACAFRDLFCWRGLANGFFSIRFLS
jgi:hypothetical protein